MSPHFKELLLAFNAHNVEYLIVGAHALAAHGHVRATKDLELWIRPDEENAQRVLRALSEFGAPVSTCRFVRTGSTFPLSLGLRVSVVEL